MGGGLVAGHYSSREKSARTRPPAGLSEAAEAAAWNSSREYIRQHIDLLTGVRIRADGTEATAVSAVLDDEAALAIWARTVASGLFDPMDIAARLPRGAKLRLVYFMSSTAELQHLISFYAYLLSLEHILWGPLNFLALKQVPSRRSSPARACSEYTGLAVTRERVCSRPLACLQGLCQLQDMRAVVLSRGGDPSKTYVPVGYVGKGTGLYCRMLCRRRAWARVCRPVAAVRPSTPPRKAVALAHARPGLIDSRDGAHRRSMRQQQAWAKEGFSARLFDPQWQISEIVFAIACTGRPRTRTIWAAHYADCTDATLLDLEYFFERARRTILEFAVRILLIFASERPLMSCSLRVLHCASCSHVWMPASRSWRHSAGKQV